jgi:hypothetical protein
MSVVVPDVPEILQREMEKAQGGSVTSSRTGAGAAITPSGSLLV